MKRTFYWQEVDKERAILRGPKTGRIAAIVWLDHNHWRVASDQYPGLTEVLGDPELTMEQMKKWTLARLGKILNIRRDAVRRKMNHLEKDMENILELLIEGEEG